MIKELIDAGLVKPCTDKAGNIIAYYMVDLDSEEFINSTIEEVHKEVEFENTAKKYLLEEQ